MLRVLGRLALSLAVLGPAPAVWAAVSTDHWPFDDHRQPATSVYQFNRALGRWLSAHGEGPPDECGGPVPPDQKKGFTREEMAEVQRTLRTDPRFKDRVFVTGSVPACISRRG